ncbi:MAG TPA: DUF222 domain-containing protein, partial [Actinomycetota bacterium]|nr:DUF222 domain-containing protein [Actinomycetota bacterium]
IDKVVEHTPFATPQTEGRLITWAQGGVLRSDQAQGGTWPVGPSRRPREAEHARPLSWWYFAESSRFGLSAELPPAQGAVVAKALERLAEQLPVMPGEEDGWCVDARRADALVALCSARIGADPDPDRATVIIHTQLEGLVEGTGGV